MKHCTVVGSVESKVVLIKCAMLCSEDYPQLFFFFLVKLCADSTKSPLDTTNCSFLDPLCTPLSSLIPVMTIGQYSDHYCHLRVTAQQKKEGPVVSVRVWLIMETSN